LDLGSSGSLLRKNLLEENALVGDVLIDDPETAGSRRNDETVVQLPQWAKISNARHGEFGLARASRKGAVRIGDAQAKRFSRGRRLWGRGFEMETRVRRRGGMEREFGRRRHRNRRRFGLHHHLRELGIRQ